MAEYTLLIILFAPFVGVVVLMFVPNRQALQVRLVAAAAAGVCMLASFYMFFAYDPARGGFQFVQRFEWSKQLGIAFYLGVDGIGTPLVLASSILLFAGIFISWHIKDRTKEFYIFLLILAAATIGFFMSLDMGILLIYKFSGLHTFDILVLREQARFSGSLATIIWLLIFFGFASIAPIWPLHSWSPVGHAAAPAATSMLHAGVLMKLGHFSIIRTCFQILPDTTHDLMPIAAILCILNILYGGYVAYYSNDTKYVIGYSSSSHMGYVFLGM